MTPNIGGASFGYEPYSEYFASQLAQAMGLDAVAYDIDVWEGKLASVCPLMNSKSVSFVPFRLGGGHLKYPYNAVVIKEFGREAFSRFRSMLMFDALIANGDRHAGNYGMMRENASGEILGENEPIPWLSAKRRSAAF